MTNSEAKLFAMVVYELRILLSGVAGPDSPYEVQLAWRLAYALHNDAEAVVDGRGFDIEVALKRIAHIDQLLGGDDGQRIVNEIRREIPN
jgi:hypothetical protein